MRVERGRYNDGVSNYQRVSNLLKNIETDTYHLEEWKANMLAVGLAGRPDLVMAVKAADERGADGKLTKDAKWTIGGLRRQAMDAAKSGAGATIGTAVHTATERLDRGETLAAIGLPYPYSADLAAYETIRKAAGIETSPYFIERSIRLTDWGVVGTFDRIGACSALEDMGVLEPGELCVIDVKTEKDPTMNLLHIGAQLACYANADSLYTGEHALDENGAPVRDARLYVPMPLVNKVVGLVVHLRDGGANLIPVDLVKGWAAAQAAYAQRERVADAKSGSWTFHIPVKLPAATELVARQAGPELAAARERLADAQVSALTRDEPAGTQVTGGGIPTPEQAIPESVAVRRPDGMTEFVPAAQAERPRADDAMAMQAIEAIGTAADMSALADLYERITGAGVPWVGEVERAGSWRAGIVQCPQRELHHGTGRCACGWREWLQA
jgi:hypothetical protein